MDTRIVSHYNWTLNMIQKICQKPLIFRRFFVVFDALALTVESKKNLDWDRAWNGIHRRSAHPNRSLIKLVCNMHLLLLKKKNRPNCIQLVYSNVLNHSTSNLHACFWLIPTEKSKTTEKKIVMEELLLPNVVAYADVADTCLSVQHQYDE